MFVLIFLYGMGRVGYLWMTAVDVSAIDNLNSGRIQVIGHGGSGQCSLIPFQPLPSNSERSIRKALAQGVDGLELDVQVTADSVLVLYHDHKLESQTTGSGCISDYTWEELKGLKYQLGFPYDLLHDEGLITLERAFDIFQEVGEFPIIHIDFHALNFCDEEHIFENVPKFCNALDLLLQQKQIPEGRIFMIGMHDQTISAYQKMSGPVQIIYEETIDFDEGINKALAYGVNHLQAKYSVLTPEGVKKAHEAGLWVITHRGKSRSGLKQRIECNVDAIQTDNIYNLKDMLDYDVQ